MSKERYGGCRISPDEELDRDMAKKYTNTYIVEEWSRSEWYGEVLSGRMSKHCNVMLVKFIPEEIHVVATRLSTYVASDSTTIKITD